jgi:hypothetical protein
VSGVRLRKRRAHSSVNVAHRLIERASAAFVSWHLDKWVTGRMSSRPVCLDGLPTGWLPFCLLFCHALLAASAMQACASAGTCLWAVCQTDWFEAVCLPGPCSSSNSAEGFVGLVPPLGPSALAQAQLGHLAPPITPMQAFQACLLGGVDPTLRTLVAGHACDAGGSDQLASGFFGFAPSSLAPGGLGSLMGSTASDTAQGSEDTTVNGHRKRARVDSSPARVGDAAVAAPSTEAGPSHPQVRMRRGGLAPMGSTKAVPLPPRGGNFICGWQTVILSFHEEYLCLADGDSCMLGHWKERLHLHHRPGATLKARACLLDVRPKRCLKP